MYDFYNEKRMQKLFGLRQRPSRFISRENAIRFAKGCTTLHIVVFVDENPDELISGYYVVCPADAEKLQRETDGAIIWI